MALWLRFEHEEQSKFGILQNDTILVHRGSMFAGSKPTGENVKCSTVRLSIPSNPSKMICLWNNSRELAAKLNVPAPGTPLYMLKAPSALLGHGETIRRPSFYQGKVSYEGELGIVIGRRCFAVREEDISEYIFGYTCVNDVTAVDIINENPTFPQWTRAKSFDTFGVFGPVIATEVDLMTLRIKTILNGQERQNYSVRDMFFPPERLVSLISRDMTLLPGDVIACGTSIGAGSMKEPTNRIEVSIEGIGTLCNVFENRNAMPDLGSTTLSGWRD